MKAPVPIPPRFPRSSMVCLILIALLAGLWIVGDRRVQSVAYQWQNMLPAQTIAPPNAPSTTGPAMEYALELSSVTLSNHSGAVYIVYGKYTSYGADHDELHTRWSEHDGWSCVGFTEKMVLPRQNPFANAVDNIDGGFQILGLGVVTSSRQGSNDTALIIPILYPMLLLSIPVIVAFRRRRRYFKRAAAGQCQRCGYTLGGVSTCPECGTLTSTGADSATTSEST